MLDQLARTMFGYTGGAITPAPPKTRLSFFYPGPDTLDIDEFRKESTESFTVVLTPPLLSAPEIYERHALRGAGDSCWSVKGIRAKGWDACAEVPRGERADDAASSSLFSGFVDQRKNAENLGPPGAAGRAGEKRGAPLGGTLLDWQEGQKTPALDAEMTE